MLWHVGIFWVMVVWDAALRDALGWASILCKLAVVVGCCCAYSMAVVAGKKEGPKCPHCNESLAIRNTKCDDHQSGGHTGRVQYAILAFHLLWCATYSLEL